MTDRPSSGTWVLLAPVLVASAAIVGLLGFVVWISFSKMELGSLVGLNGLRNYVELFANPLLLPVIRNTLAFAGVTLVVAFAFGAPLAWLAERTDLPGRSLIWMSMLASLIIPGFLLAMGWLFIAHPRIGFVNLGLMALFHLSDPPLPVTNVVGMGWVEGIALAPLIFIMTAPAMRAMDPSLEEAGRMSGASFWQMTRRVTLPLMFPALLAGVIYTAITAVGAFDIPAIIGLSSRVYTFSTFMYVLAYPVAGYPDYSTTAAGGGLMILLALALSIIYAQVLRRARQFQVVTGKAYRPRLVELGWWTAPAWVFAGLYVFFVLVLPFVVTVLFALMPYPQPLTLDVLGTLSFANFARVPWDIVGRGAVHTLELVAVVPVFVVGLSIAFSWIVLRTRLRWRFLFDGIAFLPHAVPGVLFGISATLVALFVLRRIIPIYGTIAMVMVVYTIAWLSLGTRMINGTLIQIHPELEEAGQMAGANMLGVLRRVTIPLLRPATAGLWIFTVLLCVRELTLAAFVSTPQNVTLPMVGWFLWLDGQLNHAAAVAVIVVLVLAPLLLLFLRFGRRPESMFQ